MKLTLPSRATRSRTYEFAQQKKNAMPNAAYGYVIGAAIAKGRIVSIDTHGAKTAPGVIGVLTAAEVGPLQKPQLNTAKLLGGPEIQHYHQAIAVVVAETFEQARTAAQRVQVRYARSPGAFDLEAARGTAKPQRVTGGPPDTAVGDFAGAFAAAPVKLDATYTTPDQAHAMMEPFASIAAWEGDKLTLWTANQMINWAKRDMALTLGIPQENVRVISPYIGGGFGGKLVPARRRAACGAGRACDASPGEGRADASADDQQHRAPSGHHPAHPARRDCRRQAHRRRT